MVKLLLLYFFIRLNIDADRSLSQSIVSVNNLLIELSVRTWSILIGNFVYIKYRADKRGVFSTMIHQSPFRCLQLSLFVPTEVQGIESHDARIVII